MSNSFDFGAIITAAIKTDIHLLAHYWWAVPLLLLAMVTLVAIAAFFAVFADEIRIGIAIVAVLTFLVMAFGAKKVGIAAAVVVGVPTAIVATVGLISWATQRPKLAQPAAIRQELPPARRNG